MPDDELASRFATRLGTWTAGQGSAASNCCSRPTVATSGWLWPLGFRRVLPCLARVRRVPTRPRPRLGRGAQ